MTSKSQLIDKLHAIWPHACNLGLGYLASSREGMGELVATDGELTAFDDGEYLNVVHRTGWTIQLGWGRGQ